MTESRAQDSRFRFAGFTMDTQRCVLESGGAQIRLRPKSFEVLHYLVQHHGRPVPAAELLQEVWDTAVVTEDSVRQCITEIRKALGDSNQQVIRTLPRRGYVLDVPVSRGGERNVEYSRAPGRPGTRRWIIAAVAVALIVTTAYAWLTPPPSGIRRADSLRSSLPHSIVVLRFADLSSTGDHAYLADGFSEEIIHRLAQTRSLKVIARVSSFAVNGQPIPAIAEQLGVSHVLDGSVRKDGDEIRVSAQLVDAASNSNIWSRTYNRKLDDIFDVQKEIAGAVAAALEVSLSATHATSGIDPRAYELFLEGRFFYLRRAKGDIPRAQARFEEALSISPGFARAWVGLSAVANVRLNDESLSALTPADRQRFLVMQRHAAEQAVSLGPDLPEAHIRAAAYYHQNDERRRALEHIELARSIEPEHWLVRAVVADELRRLGRIGDSIELIRSSIQQDPLNLVERANLVTLLLRAKRFAEAEAELDRIVELKPSAVHDLLQIPLLQVLVEDFEAAAASAELLPVGNQRWQALALAWYALGRRSDADAALAKLVAGSRSARDALYVAEVHAYRGDESAALHSLQRVEFGDGCRTDAVAQAAYYSPFLAKLDGTPVWNEYRDGLLRSMRDCLVGLRLEKPA